MPIRRSQKKRNAEPRPKKNQRRLVIDPMVNPGSSAHRHQARSKAHPTCTHHRMVTLAQSSPGDRSAFAPQSKTATVMLAVRTKSKQAPAERAARTRELVARAIEKIGNGGRGPSKAPPAYQNPQRISRRSC